MLHIICWDKRLDTLIRWQLGWQMISWSDPEYLIVRIINSSRFDWSINILEIYFDTLIRWQLVCQMITWSDPEDFNHTSYSIPPEDFSAKSLLTNIRACMGSHQRLELESFLVIKLLRFVLTISKGFQDPGLVWHLLSFPSRSNNTVLRLGSSPRVFLDKS